MKVSGFCEMHEGAAGHPRGVRRGRYAYVCGTEGPEENAIGFETVYSHPNFNPTDLPDPMLNSQRSNNIRSPQCGLIKGIKRLIQERAGGKRKEGGCY